MRNAVRRTKIVATLGPAWAEPDQMTSLLDAGVNVVRINASHGSPEVRAAWITQLQQLIGGRTESAAILVDLQGPRIRVGHLHEPLLLESGQRVSFAPEGEARPGEIPTTYDGLAADVHVGARILLDDGLLSVEVTGVGGGRVEAVVHYGGELKSNKGMNLPGLEVSAPALTAKDREDVEQAVSLGVDYVALSFVRRAEDMQGLRALVPRTTKLIAKIEKDTALRNLCGILDGTDAVMLSAETAVGRYPLESVRAMDRIAREMELQRPGRGVTIDAALGRRTGEAVNLPNHRPGQGGPVRTEDAIAVAVCAAAEMLSAPAILCFTSSGFTARKVATCRPTVPVIACTPEPETFRQLSLVWGVTSVLIRHHTEYEAMLAEARLRILERGLAQPGERLVVTAGVPFDMPGTTNLLKVEAV
jgi:pyruvate kinase